jgi:hypothetical protein
MSNFITIKIFQVIFRTSYFLAIAILFELEMGLRGGTPLWGRSPHTPLLLFLIFQLRMLYIDQNTLWQNTAKNIISINIETITKIQIWAILQLSCKTC